MDLFLVPERNEQDEKKKFGKIVFCNFKLESSVEAEDKDLLLSADTRPNKHWDDIFVADNVKKELQYLCQQCVQCHAVRRQLPILTDCIHFIYEQHCRRVLSCGAEDAAYFVGSLAALREAIRSDKPADDILLDEILENLKYGEARETGRGLSGFLNLSPP